MVKKIYDVTLALAADTIIYPGDPPLIIEADKSIARGDGYNLSKITLGSHTGTHIDAPKHFYDHGTTVDRLNLDCLLGQARVFQMDGEVIDVNMLKPLGIMKDDIVLFKTENSHLLGQAHFTTDYTYVTPEAAEFLALRGIKTLGFDYFSIEKYDSSSAAAHCALLKREIVIIEGLDLRQVKPGLYQMVALPLKINQGDGSPARVVLIEE